jgi:hypothetical protein
MRGSIWISILGFGGVKVCCQNYRDLPAVIAAQSDGILGESDSKWKRVKGHLSR